MEGVNVRFGSVNSGKMAVLAFVLHLAGVSVHALQFSPVAVMSAVDIPQSALIQPQELQSIIAKGTRGGPLILQVGSHVMYVQGHIPGSEYAGPAVQPEGLELLRRRVESLPRNRSIVIYCGCCPWARCPNMGTAYRFLHEIGFTNVKALYMASNFGADWIAKGYQVEK